MTNDQLESIRAARLQLLDHGDTQAASLLDWVVTAESTDADTELEQRWPNAVTMPGEVSWGTKAEAQKLRALDPNATKVAVLRWPSLKG